MTPRLAAIFLAVPLLAAGCTEAPAKQTEDPALCPGHFHVTLLVVDDGEVVAYYSGDDLDARTPVLGIHMHGDDGVIHIHPPQITCYTLRDTLKAVGVEFEDGGVDVDGFHHPGPARFYVQPWAEAWQLDADAGLFNAVVLDATRVLVMTGDGAPEAWQDQVPEIPPEYRPT